MSPEERRRMIVQSVLPLLVEHGSGVTTSQIARAAGIGEGTVFRVFKDKDELFATCFAEALKPDQVLDAIAVIDLEQSLDDRLVEAADALSAHLQRMGALMAVMHGSGRRPEHRHDPGDGRDRRKESMTAMREAMAELFEPERERLRLPAAQLAALFLSLLFSGRMRFDANGDEPTTMELVDVFLNGAVEAA
ncbi:TetR/AcrR family transcriptional regulator [Amycolatopsis azurea]|uniref:TetR family transcriptional regulator n=1 Tax=Amycolatopsis azurea DSM 43854 TaxID=1238180 RepID=M2Q5E2_9PSEU|nr:TetR/AcrR family transcriptional regulator [Amycolatopsis azurea]EMD27200.1 Transcriptional regulator, TetR family [Amycolatopsis azurea DSM 43854]OOC03930.1 TetR family transcriptional regulator [Amycolatopsis azurea DSM 43854]